ncbi:N-acyl-aromatic-L-amino acid amidohydrolase (carboxylate-forming)-like [Anneissia japonica]|uniref:N-acyl-aromatic-L-amino acid amidohydrolase (carboxylate-forming)-like n=1 Tax=Anneissia japonica TaxID=1529436 RepID=UPI0014255FAC|nr:N-acyl-aromatic-L-amino acid amidohydrolase (carboxylate-forming)-like [Anneissia japonica]
MARGALTRKIRTTGTITMATLKPVQRVALLGGVHGNEMSSVFVAQKFMKDPTDITRSSFKTTVLMGNPKAVEKCTRYIDEDLIFHFSKENLRGKNTDVSHEVQRAREVATALSKDFGSPDVVLDMHNTSANMGNCFIIQDKQQVLALHMINYMVKKAIHKAPAHILCNPKAVHSFSRHLAPNGITLELGPQPHGVLLAENYQRMQELVINSMDFLDAFNSGAMSDSFQTDVHIIMEKIDFPRDSDGNMTAMIHPQLQDRDWEALKTGDPIFLTFNGKTIYYDGQETVYPVFINEGAFYERHNAFWLTKKEIFNVPAIKAQ